jgi:hypothetical protein
LIIVNHGETSVGAVKKVIKKTIMARLQQPGWQRAANSDAASPA